jgi:hypothetical protein
VPYCWSHARSVKHLRIAKSTIQGAGQGLFAIRTKKAGLTKKELEKPVFKKDQVITPYVGERITNQEKDDRYHEYTAPYALSFKRPKGEVEIIDSACKRGLASLANHKVPSRGANAKLTENGNLSATKNIYEGSEIFAYYGPLFKFDENVAYSSKK